MFFDLIDITVVLQYRLINELSVVTLAMNTSWRTLVKISLQLHSCSKKALLLTQKEFTHGHEGHVVRQ